MTKFLEGKEATRRGLVGFERAEGGQVLCGLCAVFRFKSGGGNRTFVPEIVPRGNELRLTADKFGSAQSFKSHLTSHFSSPAFSPQQSKVQDWVVL